MVLLYKQTVGRCEKPACWWTVSRRRFFDLPAQDDARLGPSGLTPKALFTLSRILFVPPNRLVKLPRNATSLAVISGQRLATLTTRKPQQCGEWDNWPSEWAGHLTPGEDGWWYVKLKAWLRETDGTLATSTPMGKAVAFTKKQWPEYRI